MIPQQVNSSDSAARSLRADLVGTIRQASAQTGVDFGYLLQKAELESGFNPQAQAAGSSARGLFQFIDSTWLETIDRHGAAHGLGQAAAAITRDSSGKAVVQDEATKREILALRDDPRISALMAAELAKDNKASLEHNLGREVGSTELYMAHFLGAAGAARFLSTLDDDPQQRAAEVNPAAARANQAVFYKGDDALTVDQVFARFAGKFGAQPLQQPGAVDRPPADMIAGAAIPAAPRQPFAAPVHPEPFGRAVSGAGSQHDELALFALTIMQSLGLPGGKQSSLYDTYRPDHLHEWRKAETGAVPDQKRRAWIA